MNNDTTPSMEAPADAGTTEAEVDSQSEVQAQPEADQQTPAADGANEDSFFDPNNVPEELLPAYKQMQAAFTKKTQEIATARKEAEGLKEKAQLLDKYQPYIPIVEEMMSSQSPQASAELAAIEAEMKGRGFSDEAIEMMKIGANVVLRSINQNLTSRDFRSQVEGQIAQASQLDPRLNDPSLVYPTTEGGTLTFGEVVAAIAAKDPSWVRNPVAATKQAIAAVDAMMDSAKTMGKQELSASASAKAAKFPLTPSSSQSASPNAGSLTIAEAAHEAAQELGIKF